MTIPLESKRALCFSVVVAVPQFARTRPTITGASPTRVSFPVSSASASN